MKYATTKVDDTKALTSEDVVKANAATNNEGGGIEMQPVAATDGAAKADQK